MIHQKGLTKLLGLDYNIAHKKGVKSKVANAFSRRGWSQQEQANWYEISSVVIPKWLQKVIDSYEFDTLAQECIKDLIINPNVKNITATLKGY